MGKRFNYNRMYAMRYKADGAKKGTLHVYDLAPLMIPIALGPRSILGLNIHWCPPWKRKMVIKHILEISELKKSNKHKVRLLYSLFKSDPVLKDFAYKGIRRYLRKNISRLIEIPPQKWEEVLGINKYRMRKAYKSKRYKHH